MIRAYYYLFYKLYKFGEWSPSSYPSDFTATYAIVVFETMLFGVLKFYYIEFLDKSAVFTFVSASTLIPLILIFLINYFAFLRNDNWQGYVSDFEKLPKRKNIIGTWIVIAILLSIILNVVLAFNIMGQITSIH